MVSIGAAEYISWSDSPPPDLRRRRKKSKRSTTTIITTHAAPIPIPASAPGDKLELLAVPDKVEGVVEDLVEDVVEDTVDEVDAADDVLLVTERPDTVDDV